MFRTRTFTEITGNDTNSSYKNGSEEEKLALAIISEKLRTAQEQSENGEFVDGDIVLEKMRKKFGYGKI